MRLKKFKESAKNAELKFCRESCVNGKKFTDNNIYKMYTHKPQIIKKADITPIEVSITMSHLNAWIKVLEICFEDFDNNKSFYEDKIKTAKFYFKRVLPRVENHFKTAATGSDYIMNFKFN